MRTIVMLKGKVIYDNEFKFRLIIDDGVKIDGKNCVVRRVYFDLTSKVQTVIVKELF